MKRRVGYGEVRQGNNHPYFLSFALHLYLLPVTFTFYSLPLPRYLFFNCSFFTFHFHLLPFHIFTFSPFFNTFFFSFSPFFKPFYIDPSAIHFFQEPFHVMSFFCNLCDILLSFAFSHSASFFLCIVFFQTFLFTYLRFVYTLV